MYKPSPARAFAWLPLALWLLPCPAAATPVTLDAESETVDLVPHLDALVDDSGELGVQDVAHRRFVPVRELDGGLGRWPGQRQPVVWLRFSVRVKERAPGDDWYFVLGRPYDRGTLYAGGRALPVTLDAAGTSFTARLPLAPGTQTFYLRVPGPIARPSILHLATATGQEELLLGLLTGQGVYLGVVFAMLLVNVLLGVLLRDRAHLWYVAFILASAAAFSLQTGTVSRYLLTGVPATALFRPRMATLALMVLTGIQFSRLFLDTARIAPRWDRVMRAYLALAAVVLVGSFVLPDLLALDAVALLGMLVPFVAISAGVVCWRAGSRWARFYLVGWTIFTLGAFLFASPIQPFGVDAFTIFQWSSAIEAALFALALVDRMRILRRERTLAEQKVVQSEKLAVLGQLVAGVAHEVNNPNNFLTFNLPILQEYVDGLRPHLRDDPNLRLFGMTVDEFFVDTKTLIGNMQHGTERIAGIVSQLKSYVRQHDEAQWEDADVNRVVTNATTLVRTQVGRLVKSFETRLAPELPTVRMSPARIEQVVINLVLNAAQSAGKAPDGRVEIRTAREGGHVVIAVEDNGAGVPDDLRARIFEPFFTTKSGEQGTGMGLAISQRIVDEHGGTLELVSSAARSTCFVVRLPIPVEAT